MNERQIVVKMYQKLDGELQGAQLEEFNRFLDEHPEHYQTFLNIQRMEKSLISGGKNTEVTDLISPKTQVLNPGWQEPFMIPAPSTT